MVKGYCIFVAGNNISNRKKLPDMLQKAVLIILIIVLLPGWGIAGAGLTDVAGGDPGLFIVMMVLLAGFIGACLIAIAIMLIVAAIGCCMILAGVLTVSLIASWYYKSAKTGLNVFTSLLFAIIGITGGLVAGWILQKSLFHSSSPATIIISVALVGCLTGIAIARIMLALFNRLIKSVVQQ